MEGLALFLLLDFIVYSTVLSGKVFPVLIYIVQYGYEGENENNMGNSWICILGNELVGLQV